MQEGHDPIKYYIDVEMALFVQNVKEDIMLAILKRSS